MKQEPVFTHLSHNSCMVFAQELSVVTARSAYKTDQIQAVSSTAFGLDIRDIYGRCNLQAASRILRGDTRRDHACTRPRPRRRPPWTPRPTNPSAPAAASPILILHHPPAAPPLPSCSSMVSPPPPVIGACRSLRSNAQAAPSIAPDMLGYGRSDSPTDKVMYKYSAMAADIIDSRCREC